MKKILILTVLPLLLFHFEFVWGATDIQVNPKMDYNSDCNDGPILAGKDLSDVKLSPDKPNYIMFYSNLCFNSKRQAKRTAELYQKYQDKVKFILIDIDKKYTPEQQDLVKKHFKGYIPHVTVYDSKGKVVYDQSGEVETKILIRLLNQVLTAKVEEQSSTSKK